MHSRLRHFRAAFLLLASASVVFWIVSFWFPINDYLVFLSSDAVAEYEVLLKTFVAIYLSFCAVNLLVAVLFVLPLSSTMKFWLAIAPAAVLCLTPFVAAIPLAIKFSDRNYFEVFQAMFRLIRFTKADTFALALACIFIATALNLLAAFMVRKASYAPKVPSKLVYRYLIYTAVVILFSGIFTAANLYNSSLRALDRASCQSYSVRELPQLDDDVPTFLSDLMLYGQSAGTKLTQDSFVTFSMISRQYFAALNSDADSGSLAQLEANVALAKERVGQICSEFGPETGQAESSE